MPRNLHLNNLGPIWWGWVGSNQPNNRTASQREIAKMLDISVQALNNLVKGRKCTLDRIAIYTDRLSDNGWPSAKIIVEAGKATIENSSSCFDPVAE